MAEPPMPKWLSASIAFVLIALGVFLLAGTYGAIFHPELFYAN